MDEKTRVQINEKDYKSIVADFFDDEYLIESEYQNYRIDKGGQRFYMRFFEDGTYLKAPSFSEIMNRVLGVNPRLAQWMADLGTEQARFESRNSANYGTYFHVLCGEIMKGKPVTLDEMVFFEEIEIWCLQNEIDFDELQKWYKLKKRNICDDAIGFICWLKEYNVKPIAMEYPLMHPEGLWAGTCDLICRLTYDMKEIIAMVDIKSSLQPFHESHEIQLYAYKQLWDMEFNHLQIDRVFNYGCNSFRRETLKKYLSGGKSGRFKPYQFKDQTESNHAHKWQYYVDLYHSEPKNLQFSKRFEYDAIKTIDKDSDLSEIINEYDLFQNLTEKKEAQNEKQNNKT